MSVVTGFARLDPRAQNDTPLFELSAWPFRKHLCERATHSVSRSQTNNTCGRWNRVRMLEEGNLSSEERNWNQNGK